MVTKSNTAPGAKAEVFWGEIAPVDHAVQIYQDDEVFLRGLEDYVAAGLAAGEGVIVIATPEHGQALDQRLRARGVDLSAALAEGRYVPLEAGATLAQFMDGHWPNDERFRQVVGGVLKRARGPGRRVRAFGEMVALLWNQGHHAATVRLEYLWNKFREEEPFELLCAYPMSGFTQDAVASLFEICAQHSRAVDGGRPRGS